MGWTDVLRAARWARRRRMLVVLVLVTTALAMRAPAVVAAPAQPAPTYQNPLVNGKTHNPFILRTADAYYAYFDGVKIFGEQFVPAYRSTDLVHWSQLSPLNVLPASSAGAWVDKSAAANFTAPSVKAISETRYVLFFTGKAAATGKTCIGRAVASSPAGPFVGDDEPLVCDAKDPSAVPLPPGAPIQEIVYVRVGGDGGIYNQILGPDGEMPGQNPSPPTLLYKPQPTTWWQHSAIRRPAVAWNGNQATLLFSDGPPNSLGSVVTWTSCNEGLGMLFDCGATTKQQGPVTPWIAGTTQVNSPGGVQVFNDDPASIDSTWIVYDGLPANSCAGPACTGNRTMRVDKLCFGDGRPRTNAPTSTPQLLARPTDCAADVPAPAEDWRVSWASGVSRGSANVYPNGFAADKTLRQLVHTSVGGSAVRVRISNVHGTAGTSLKVGAASVAVSRVANGANGDVVGPVTPLTFGGATSIEVPAGHTIVSDPVALTLPEGHDVAVSLHFSEPTGVPSAHRWHGQTSYVGTSNLTGEASGAGFTDRPSNSSFYLTAVDVLRPNPSEAIVVLGDSLTDGIGCSVAPDRWYELLSSRLQAAGRHDVGLASVAVGGHSLLPAENPGSGLGRMTRDVLSQTGVRSMVLYMGRNDIVQNRSAAEIVAGLRTAIDRAHAAGIQVIGVTQPPLWYNHPVLPDPPGPGDEEAYARQIARNEVRLAVNAATRPGLPDALPFDQVVDFDAALRRPDDPDLVNPSLSCGDTAHFWPAGNQAMADAFSLEDFGLPPTATYQNALVNGQTANPFIVRDDATGTYYAYFNGLEIFGKQYVPAYRTTDLVTWQQLSPLNVLPGASAGTWADTSSPYNFTSPAVRHMPNNPANRRWVLYFTAKETGSARKCIGAATAGSPAGPFVGTGQPLVCPSGGAQDPSVVPAGVDPSKPQIVYRDNGDGAIYGLELQPDGITPVAGGTAKLYEPMPNWWHEGIVERPAVALGSDGVVYLLVTGGPANTTGRGIGWSACDVEDGTITSCRDQTALGTWIGNTAAVAGPSGVQVVQDGNHQWITYNAHPTASCNAQGVCNAPPRMRIDKLCFSHGQPRTNAPSSTPQSLTRRGFCTDDVPGPLAPGEPLDIAPVTDDGTFVPKPATVILRDGGPTAVIGGRTTWLWADTWQSTPAGCHRTPNSVSFGVPSPEAAGPNWARDPLDANGCSKQFVPYTAEEITYNETHDDTIDLWPTGIVRLPDGSGMGFFLKLKILGPSQYETMGMAAVRIPVGSDTSDRPGSPLACNPTCLFDAAQVDAGAGGEPVMGHDGYLYIFGDGGALARAPVAEIEDRAAWRFWTGTGWGTLTEAKGLEHVRAGGTISYNPYLDQYINFVGGGIFQPDEFIMQAAPALTGPWSPFQLAFKGARCLNPDEGRTYAGFEHPELAMDGGRTVAVTYRRPGGGTCPEQNRYVNLELR